MREEISSLFITGLSFKQKFSPPNDNAANMNGADFLCDKTPQMAPPRERKKRIPILAPHLES